MTRSNPSRTLSVRRALVAIAVGLLALLVFGAALGVVAATDAQEAKVPASLRLGAPHIGDRAAYVRSIVVPSEGGFQTSTPAAPNFTLGWTGPELVRDREGNLYQAARLITQDTGPQWFGNRSHLDWFVSGDRNLVGLEVAGSQVTSTRSAILGVPVSRNDNRSGAWHFFLSPTPASAFCVALGLGTPAELDLARPVKLYDDCFLPGTAGGSPISPLRGGTFRAVGLEETAFGQAVVLEATHADPPAWFWLVEGLPYPAQYMFQTEEGYFLFFQLSAFTRGTQPLPGSGPVVQAPPPIESFERPPWLLPEQGVTYEFPLSDAYQRIRSETRNTAVREFFSKHPDAMLLEARNWEFHLSNRLERTWDLVFADRQAGLSASITQGEAQADGVPLLEAATRDYGIDAHPSGPTNWTSEMLPRQMPSLGSLEAQWRFYAQLAPGAVDVNHVAISFECSAVPCKPRYEVGHFSIKVDVGSIKKPGQVMGGSADVNFLWNDFGSLMLLGGHMETDQTADVGPVHDLTPPAEAASLPKAPVAHWMLPRGGYAYASGILALMTAVLYWIWPAIRSLGFGTLYSRIEKPVALDHPVRAAIFDLIQQNPGIHFAQIGRALDLGHGATAFHVGKLVATGLVAKTTSGRYACYTAADVDRRLAAAAPVLKSPGAKRVLESSLRIPGRSPTSIAEDVGLTAPSVHYHLQRLRQASLVRLEKVSGLVRVFPGPMAEATISSSPHPVARGRRHFA